MKKINKIIESRSFIIAFVLLLIITSSVLVSPIFLCFSLLLLLVNKSGQRKSLYFMLYFLLIIPIASFSFFISIVGVTYYLFLFYITLLFIIPFSKKMPFFGIFPGILFLIIMFSSAYVNTLEKDQLCGYARAGGYVARCDCDGFQTDSNVVYYCHGNRLACYVGEGDDEKEVDCENHSIPESFPWK